MLFFSIKLFHPQESELESEMDDLADEMGVLLERLAPDAFDNLTAFSQEV